MYRDNTLIPTEAVRLLALGILATGERSYSGLASEVRHFTGRIVGPSLELVGAPLEVLKVEGLIELVAGDEPPDDETSPLDQPMRITAEGRDELLRLLESNVRPPVSELNKLIIALKVRFLHLLDRPQRQLQLEMLSEMCERELARLTDLRSHHAAEPGHLVAWLDREIAQTRERLDWYRELLDQGEAQEPSRQEN